MVHIHINNAGPISDNKPSLLELSFAKNPNKTLSRENLIDLLEGRMQGRSIDVAIARLRSKFESDPKKPHFLMTVRNLGWKLQIDKLIG